MAETKKPSPDERGNTVTEHSSDQSSIEKASIKEAIGKLVGDPRIEADGKAEKTSSESDATSGSTRRP